MDIFILMVVIFVLGYTTIALEHPLKVNKAPTALFMGMLLWIILAVFNEKILHLGYSPTFEMVKQWANDLASYVMPAAGEEHMKHSWHHIAELGVNSPENGNFMEFVGFSLGEHLNDIGQILFFLLGAMTIVETVDRYRGFELITNKIKTTNPVKLIWVLSILTFFMSALLDNLTTTIVMVALLRKLVDDQKLRWFFASVIVIAANSGGAWSPIGDVTTIMLWISGNITTMKIIEGIFIPSLLSLIVPLFFVSMMLKGSEIHRPKVIKEDGSDVSSNGEKLFVLIMGIGGLLFVPVLKTLTHLPPYIGMLFSLGVLWITTEILILRKPKEHRSKYSVITILQKVDVPTIFFFLGILMAVAALQTAGHLDLLSKWLDKATNTNYYLIGTAIGILSSVVDNVPLVAGSIGMYPLAESGHLAQDGLFWEFLAYTAGTGGSMLIIGSAAGVAAMGLEKIDFIWYAKKISWLAAIGYFAGIAFYWAENTFFHAMN